MQNIPAYPIARSWLGAVLALVVLILDIVFMVLGQIELKQGLLIGGLALALLI
jgi:hypothetical protein